MIETLATDIQYLVVAFAWTPSEIDKLDMDEVGAYAELAKARLKRML